MARIVIREDCKPMQIEVGGESKWICMCGLSANYPYCDGAHKKTTTEEPGKLYKYEGGAQIEVK